MVVFHVTLYSHDLVQLLKVNDKHNISTYVVGQFEVLIVSVKVNFETSIDVDISQLSKGQMPLISYTYVNILIFLVLLHDRNGAILRIIV